MKIERVIWLPEIVDKLSWKHHIDQEEVEEMLVSRPLFRKIQRGHVPGENLYSALGRTEAGRYNVVFFYRQIKSRSFDFKRPRHG